jgi:hypothetical protein
MLVWEGAIEHGEISAPAEANQFWRCRGISRVNERPSIIFDAIPQAI